MLISSLCLDSNFNDDDDDDDDYDDDAVDDENEDDDDDDAGKEEEEDDDDDDVNGLHEGRWNRFRPSEWSMNVAIKRWRGLSWSIDGSSVSLHWSAFHVQAVDGRPPY